MKFIETVESGLTFLLAFRDNHLELRKKSGSNLSPINYSPSEQLQSLKKEFRNHLTGTIIMGGFGVSCVWAAFEGFKNHGDTTLLVGGIIYSSLLFCGSFLGAAYIASY